MTTNNWNFRYIHKYSSPQSYGWSEKYRIKNYVTNKWVYIHKTNDGWRFKQKDFPNMTILRQWLNTENKMFKLEKRRKK